MRSSTVLQSKQAICNGVFPVLSSGSLTESGVADSKNSSNPTQSLFRIKVKICPAVTATELFFFAIERPDAFASNEDFLTNRSLTRTAPLVALPDLEGCRGYHPSFWAAPANFFAVFIVI